MNSAWSFLNYWLLQADGGRVILNLSYFLFLFPYILANAMQGQPLVWPKATAPCKIRARKLKYMEKLKRRRQANSIIYPSL